MSGAAILVVGDLMRDVVVRLAGPMRRGTDQHAAITSMAGGSAANTAAWLAREGCGVRLLACVGAADIAGERDRLARLGVAPMLVPHATLPTGTLVALVEPDGERSFLTDRGANDGLGVADLPADLLDGVGHLHVSGYAFVGAETREAARAVIARARGLALPVSFDPGSAGFIADCGAAAMLHWSAGADLCVANGDEAEALTGCADPAGQLAALAGRFTLAVLKRGRLGAMARDREGRCWEASAPAVCVTDTIGAGDAFLAGFLAAFRAGQPVEACLARAVAQGSFAATLAGGLPPAP